MANNFLNLFETKAEQDKNYITEEGHNEFPWVSLCKENNKFYYTSYIEFKDKGEVGDFYYDNGKFSTDVDINIATPVGIVVIPENFIPSSPKCRIMSLVNMDCTNPENGSGQQVGICFGNYGVHIEELPYYTQGPIGSGSTKVVGLNACAILPSDSYTTAQYSGDPTTYYTYATYWWGAAVSPYLVDENGNETFNTEYIRTESPSSSLNKLSDLNGYYNTTILTQDKYTSGQTDWKTASQIYSDYGAGFSPAACVCKRFKAGNLDWYLPSAGELGFIIPRMNKLNKQLSKLKRQTINYATIIMKCDVQSSTIDNDNENVRCQTLDGNLYRIPRQRYDNVVRAFAII